MSRVPAPVTPVASYERTATLTFTAFKCAFTGPWPIDRDEFGGVCLADAHEVFGEDALGLPETFELSGEDTPEYTIRFTAYVPNEALLRVAAMVEEFRCVLETWLDL